MDYTYKNKDEKKNKIAISDEHSALVNQASKDFETSRRYILSQEYHIWRGALKSYHLSTYDRKVQLWKDSWKQNITIGLIRSFVDILVASINEKPLSFIGTAVNKKWQENKEAIINTLGYISDRGGFHKQLKETMANGLIFGEIAMRVGYKKNKKEEVIFSIADGWIIEEIIDTEEINIPYAVNVSIFNVFPDPYSGSLRYVTERDVVSYQNFITTFWHMIRGKDNESPFKQDDFLSLLPINPNGADHQDYGNIINQIHQRVNEEFAEKDAYDIATQNTGGQTSGNQDKDINVTEWLIEFKITWYYGRVILIANWYPVYIGKNPYGFIPYVIKAANHTKARFWEWIPYMLKGLEEVGNSFISNYLDSARSIANPTMVVQKNLMINDSEYEDGTPWGIIHTEDNLNGNAIYRLDKWGLNDFGILPLLQQIASQITGISEYDQGIAARERTATGALAVSMSSQKRMSPYVSNFLDAISIIAQMWLKLAKKYWTKDEFIYILDEAWEQLFREINNKQLIGGLNITLEAEWIFWVNDALELNKLISMYQTLAPSGFIQSPEIAKEIIKRSGYIPSKFITEPWKWIIPNNADKLLEISNKTWVPWKNAPWLSEDLWAAVTPNTDLWNEGKWNPNT